jgi:hypothetical protein
MTRVLSPRQIWGIPIALGVLSLVGLVAALVADGWGDALSWLALTVPTVISLWGFRRQREAGPSRPIESPERRAVRPAVPPRG